MPKRDTQLKLKRKFGEKKDEPQRYRAVLCASNGSRTSGSVWANQDWKLVYFQFFGSGGVGVARCQKIEAQLGLGVYVGKTDDGLEWQVLEDDSFLRRTATDTRGYQSISASDFEPGGRLQLWLYTKLIVPLATYPTSSSLKINVTAGDYPYAGTRKTFSGTTNLDLSASVPAAGLWRYVGVYLDSSNALQTVDGTASSTASDPAEPSWPAGAFRLSAVRLSNGQTTISIADDIFDRRMVWSDENGGGGWPFDSILTVSSTNPDADYTTITNAVTASSDGDIILLEPETFTVTASITVNKAITIMCLDPNGALVQTSTDDVEVFNLIAVGAKLLNLNILNAGGGTAHTCVTIAANGVTVENCTCTYNGGAAGGRAIHHSGGTEIVIKDVDSYSSGQYTAYIGAADAKLTNVSATNTGNHATRIAAIYLDGNDAILENCTAIGSNAHATGFGYGFYQVSATGVELRNCYGDGTGSTANDNYGYRMDNGTGTVTIIGGQYLGDAEALYCDGTSLQAALPRLDNVDTTNMGGGTLSGNWLDTSGNVKFFGTSDVFPQASVNGLNARFERLFGDDRPANTYRLTNRRFSANNFTGRLAGYEDAQTSPYSFGGSPGGFSLSVGADSQAESQSFPHFLTLFNYGANSCYQQWTDSTAYTLFYTLLSVSPLLTASDYFLGEIRVWGVQSPGAGDNYFSIRYNWKGATYPQMPLRLECRYGTGVSFSAADGTLAGETPILPGALYRVLLALSNSSGNGACTYVIEYGDGQPAGAVSATVGGWPANGKTIQWYIAPGTASRLNLDEVWIE